MGVYVEVLIRAPLEAVWTQTQQPGLHQRWDLRFAKIEYLPRLNSDSPQLFRYSTRIGFGVEIAGEGESVGQRELTDGSRTSTLTFKSSDPRSLILKGSGYWKYTPTTEGIRFLTGYDYQPRYGAAGRAFDSLVFRPLMGWATAWSFDRLRLWLERNIEPEAALRNALRHVIARLTLAFVFIYQGAVPKLIARDADELSLLSSLGVPPHMLPVAAAFLGTAEILFGVCLIVYWRSRWPLAVTLLLMAIATLTVIFVAPRYLASAFNPVSLNVAVASLALIDLLADTEAIPSASRCLRQPSGKS